MCVGALRALDAPQRQSGREVGPDAEVTKASESGMTFTGFLVMYDPPKPGIDLGSAIKSALNSFKGATTVESRTILADRPYPMARLSVTSTDAETGRVGRHLLYVFIRADRAWSLNYVAPAERFDDVLPAFEKSAASFTLTE